MSELSKLENKFEEPALYNISDVFIPLKSFRHLPKILDEKDSFVKYTELVGNLSLPFAQAAFYYCLYAV